MLASYLHSLWRSFCRPYTVNILLLLQNLLLWSFAPDLVVKPQVFVATSLTPTPSSPTSRLVVEPLIFAWDLVVTCFDKVFAPNLVVKPLVFAPTPPTPAPTSPTPPMMVKSSVSTWDLVVKPPYFAPTVPTPIPISPMPSPLASTPILSNARAKIIINPKFI